MPPQIQQALAATMLEKTDSDSVHGDASDDIVAFTRCVSLACSSNLYDMSEPGPLSKFTALQTKRKFSMAGRSENYFKNGGAGNHVDDCGQSCSCGCCFNRVANLAAGHQSRGSSKSWAWQ
eukprot:653426-Karenia_brevis.AAC.1